MTFGDDRSSAAGGRPQHLMLPFHHPKCPHETFLRKFITQNVQLTKKELKNSKIFSKKHLPNSAFFANFVQLYW
jgi:hypothetical protein